MIRQASETKPLGLVWLYCPYPVLARGLDEVLKEEALVHSGEQPPEGSDPSCVLFCADEIEGMSGKLKAVRAAAPDAPVVVFGLHDGLLFARAALLAGARGFVHVGMPSRQVIRALSVASRGEIAISRALLKDLVTGRPVIDLDSLTLRQREILRLVVEGRTNAQIGRELFLSESTIKQHLRAAYKTLKVRNRTEAARLLRDEEI